MSSTRAVAAQLVGRDPCVTLVFPQPSHLPLGILPRVDLDLLHGFFKGALPVEIGEELLVAYGV